MTQRAVVRRRLGADQVEITVKRESVCGHSCADCAGCAAMLQSVEITAVAEDRFGAQAGQRVTVESATKKVLWCALGLYLLPFVGLFVAAVALQRCSVGVAALGSVAAFIVVLAGVSIPLDRWISRHKAVTYRVVALEE